MIIASCGYHNILFAQYVYSVQLQSLTTTSGLTESSLQAPETNSMSHCMQIYDTHNEDNACNNHAMHAIVVTVIISDQCVDKQQIQLEKEESKSKLSPKVPDNFSEEMNIVHLSQWLLSHPKIGTDYQEDINILNGIFLKK